jgi:hypothetical protein
MQRRIRQIASSQSNNAAYGITIPKEIAIFLKETYFYIERSGNDIILKSGTFIEINEKVIENYQFEDCRA